MLYRNQTEEAKSEHEQQLSKYRQLVYATKTMEAFIPVEF
jgi:hypothetical protein